MVKRPVFWDGHSGHPERYGPYHSQYSNGNCAGINKAIIVAIVYLVIQIFEGNVIMPAIQAKLIKMPAAVTIVAQLFMGILSGVWGLILATPLVAILIVVIQETYVKKMNGR